MHAPSPCHHVCLTRARCGLLRRWAQACAERIETLLLAKRFDQLGALQLDRDVRALTKRLGELSSRSVRERLARLAQPTHTADPHSRPTQRAS